MSYEEADVRSLYISKETRQMQEDMEGKQRLENRGDSRHPVNLTLRRAIHGLSLLGLGAHMVTSTLLSKHIANLYFTIKI